MDNAIRAITIGVGVIISVATISLLLTYYNTAKSGVTSLGAGTDISASYDTYIREILTRSNVYGSDIINLINYSEQNQSLKLTIDGNRQFGGIRSAIHPNQKFSITTEEREGILYVHVSGEKID